MIQVRGFRMGVAILVGVAFLATGVVLAGGKPLTYPKSQKVDQVDEFHGVKVADPYRWLEDPDTPDARTWIEAQNKVTFGWLGEIAARDQIRERLTNVWNYERYSSPSQYGGKYFFTKNDGLQNQSPLYYSVGLRGEPKLLLDPNSWSKDGTVALAGTDVTEDGKLLAYGVSKAGSDWEEWKVRDIDAGKDLPDTIDWVKFSSASWTKDGKGFFYSRYDEPKEGSELRGANYFHKLYYHKLGTPQSEDQLVYERKDQKEWGFGGSVTDDGAYLIINVWKGTERNNLIFYKDLTKPGAPIVELIKDFEAQYAFVDNDGPVFYFRSASSPSKERDRVYISPPADGGASGNVASGDKKSEPTASATSKVVADAPRGRLIAIDTNKPDKANWKEIIPQAAETLQGVSLVGDRFIASYLKDAYSQVKVFDMAGKLEREIKFPALGTAGGFGGRRTDKETFYVFTSFVHPTTVYRYDVATGESTILRQPDVDVRPDEFETKQVFYKSKDGTKVPMFITHKKGVKLDGNNPTLLYGYGGFNASITPTFNVARVVWMEMGGIYAVPNLRGGGEYGKEWHDAGKKLNKQNVFDDFIAAAEWLVDNKYTNPSKLAIFGGSNGGLLVGACMTQRPDLFGAAIPAVGVLDMLRFEQFTIGWAWASDYGSVKNEDEFKALLAYSPLHNLKPGTSYPATLITTGDHDDRVVPAHSFKFAAALQEANSGPNPMLIRIQTQAGHGAGKPTKMIIEEAADMWAFLVRALNVPTDQFASPDPGKTRSNPTS